MGWPCRRLRDLSPVGWLPREPVDPTVSPDRGPVTPRLRLAALPEVARCRPSEHRFPGLRPLGRLRTVSRRSRSPSGCRFGLATFPARSPGPKPLRTRSRPCGPPRRLPTGRSRSVGSPTWAEAPVEGAERYAGREPESNQIAVCFSRSCRSFRESADRPGKRRSERAVRSRTTLLSFPS